VRKAIINLWHNHGGLVQVSLANNPEGVADVKGGSKIPF